MKKVIRINLEKLWNGLFILFIIFPFIQQRSYAEYPSIIWMIYRLWMVASSMCVIAAAFLNAGRLKIPNEVFPLLIFFGIYILATLIKAPSEIATTCFYTITHCIYVLFLCYQFKYNFETILRMLSLVYGVFIYLNFILDLAFPAGLYHPKGSYHHIHLLGDDNSLIFLMLPGMICMICYSYITYRKIKWYVWLAAVLCDYSLIAVWSASAMVCMTLFIALIIIGEKRPVFRIPSLTLLSVFIVAVFVCFFGLSNQSVQHFIVNILHKSVTLSGRTIIWNQAYEIIRDSWIIGNGSYWRVGQFLLNGRIYPSHTPYLQILIDGGILLMIPFVICIILAFVKAKNIRQNFSLYVAAAGLAFMLINYITEHSQLYHFYVIYLLIIYSSSSHKSALPQQKIA